MDDALFTATDVAGLPPNDTPEVVVVNPEPLRSVPWIVTAGAPPLSGPELGLTDVTVGAACCTIRMSLDVVVEVPPGGDYLSS